MPAGHTDRQNTSHKHMCRDQLLLALLLPPIACNSLFEGNGTPSVYPRPSINHASQHGQLASRCNLYFTILRLASIPAGCTREEGAVWLLSSAASNFLRLLRCSSVQSISSRLREEELELELREHVDHVGCRQQTHSDNRHNYTLAHTHLHMRMYS